MNPQALEAAQIVAFLGFWMLALANLVFSLVSVRASIMSFRHARGQGAATETLPLPEEPPVTVFVPCAGVEHGLEDNLRSHVLQRYPRFRVVFIVANAQDPAVTVVRRVMSGYRRGDPSPEASAGMCAADSVSLFVAGNARNQSQKVKNLQEAVRDFSEDARIYAFADSDGCVGPEWLVNLVQPLAPVATQAAGADEPPRLTTGYRFYMPEPGGLAALLRSSWNAGILTLLGDHERNFAWGGSMAITRRDFERCGGIGIWDGVLSDDYALTNAVRGAGGRVHYRPRCLVPSEGPVGVRSFLRWSGRQLAITRVYWPGLFWIAAVSQALPALFLVGGLPLAAATPAALPATLAYVGNLGIGWLSGYLRTRALAIRYPKWGPALRKHLLGLTLATPLSSLVTFQATVRSLSSRRIRWRSHVYEMISPTETRILEGPGIEDRG